MERIRQLLREIEQEILSERFIRLYQEIREKHSPIRPFLTPKDLIDRLHTKDNPDYLLNDTILSSLIQEYQTHLDSGLIGSYLFLLFKPGLFKLFSQFRARPRQFPAMSEPDLFMCIVTFFLEELGQLDSGKDTSKIAATILGRVKDRLRYYFTKLFDSFTAESNLKAEAAPLALDSPDIEAEQAEAFF